MRQISMGVILCMCLLLTRLYSEVPALVVVGASEQRAAAEHQRKRVEQMLSRLKAFVPLKLRKIEGVWLVELEPGGMNQRAYEELQNRLKRAGMAPVAVRPEEQALTPSSSRRIWQWGALIVLAAAGAFFFARRFAQARRLGRSQKDLQRRQEGLEGKLHERGSS